MSWFVLSVLALLAGAGSHTEATVAVKQLQLRRDLPPLSAGLQLQSGYLSSPSQYKTILINGMPYYVLKEELSYMPAAQAQASAALTTLPITSTLAANSLSDSGSVKILGDGVAAGAAPPPSFYTAPAAPPAAPPAPEAPPAAPEAPPAAPEAPPAAPEAPSAPAASAAGGNSQTTVYFSNTGDTQAPASAAAAAPATAPATGRFLYDPPRSQSTQVFLSSSAHPGMAPHVHLPPVRLTVSNPKVTVHRTETTYYVKQPPQVENRRITIDFVKPSGQIPATQGGAPISLSYSQPADITVTPSATSTAQWILNNNNNNAPAAPSAAYTAGQQTQVSAQVNSVPATVVFTPPKPATQWMLNNNIDDNAPAPAAPSAGQQTVVSAQVNSVPATVVFTPPRPALVSQSQPAQYTLVQTPSSNVVQTLAQGPIVTLVVDPATQSWHFADQAGQRIYLPGIGESSQPSQPSLQYSAPVQVHANPSGASESFKSQDMTGLVSFQPNPTAYTATASVQPAQQQLAQTGNPMSLILSTSRSESADGDQQPRQMAREDEGPSRGDTAPAPYQQG